MLQFKWSAEVPRLAWFGGSRSRTSTEWRFVPHADLSCRWRHPEHCPIRLTQWSPSSIFGESSSFLGCFAGHESEMKSFVERWPFIEDYFASIRARQEESRKREEAARHVKTIYLTTQNDR